MFPGCPSWWNRHSGSCYKLSNKAAIFEVAVQSCQISGAYLVEIQSENENNFVASLPKTNMDLWIGYTDKVEEKKWVWIGSQTTGGYSNWHSGEPNNAGNQDCALIWGHYQGRTTWDDRSCGDKKHFVCEMGKSPVIHGDTTLDHVAHGWIC